MSTNINSFSGKPTYNALSEVSNISSGKTKKPEIPLKLIFTAAEVKANKNPRNRQPTALVTEKQLESKVLAHFKLDVGTDLAEIKKRLDSQKNPFDYLQTNGDLTATYNLKTGNYEITVNVDADLYKQLEGKVAEIKNQIEAEKQTATNTNPNEVIAEKQGIDNSASVKKDIANKYNQTRQNSVSALSESDSTVKNITNTLETVTGTTDPYDANQAGKQFNRFGVSTLRLTGKIMEAGNYFGEKFNDAIRYFASDSVDAILDKTDQKNRDLANSLQNAQTAVVGNDDYFDRTNAKNGIEVPVMQDLANRVMYFPDPNNVSNAIDSAVKGGFKPDDGTYSDQVGKIIGGLNPAADVRDVVAGGKDVYEGKSGGWVNLGTSIIGGIPGGGDLLKPILRKVFKEIFVKTEKELVKEVAEKLVKEGIEKETADKIAKEEVKNAIHQTVTKRYDEIAKNGHAVQRHGESITETQLDDRAMNGFDPVTGMTDDAYNKFPDGTPRQHNSAKNATKFTNKESLVKAEIYARNTQKYKDAVSLAETDGSDYITVKDIKLDDIFGANYKDQVFGKTRLGSRNNPTGTAITDFTDGTLTAKFKKDASGKWNLDTMFPEPKP